MAEPVQPQTTVPAAPPPWTTWEELLLACAVHRHGTAAWDSVAAEVQKRSPAAAAALSALHCQDKYLDLKLRYGDKKSGSCSVPWLDELKSTRVQELRREVQRCDLSIVSLELKVKRLKEERESGENPDPEKGAVGIEKTGEKTSEPDRSVNESNSSEPEPAANEPGICEPVADDSCNGSSDSVERKPVGEPVKVEPVKETSDLQSSAELGNEGEDPAVEKGLVRSQSLVHILEMVRSHKLGSAFEGRVMLQEIEDKKNAIRQHVDIETIHTRLEEGSYSDCKKKFFRDLLLLFNNATLSFAKSSPQFAAAIELRKITSQKIYQRNTKSDLSTREQTLSLSSKPETEPSESLVIKPRISGPIIVCRKRSSIASKASGSSSGGERKKVQNISLLEDKPLLDWKQPNKSSVNLDETENTKKRTSDRFVSGSKNSKKNGKNNTSPNQNKSSEAKDSSPKPDKNNPIVIGAKKKNAISVNKSKQKSPTLIESLKDSENKKSGGGSGRGERKREQKGRPAKEQESPVKRNNSRVGKRGVAITPRLAVSGKRGREGGDAEAVTSSQPKKRTRR